MATGFINILEGFGADRRPVMHLFWANILISVSLWLAIGIGTLMHIDLCPLIPLFSLPHTLSSLLSAPWTVLTYMFTQYSFLHLLCNMIWLYWFGGIISYLQDFKIYSLYILGGLLGAVAFIGISSLLPSGAPYLAGSSASVLAVMSTAAILHPDMEIRLSFIGTFRLKWIVTVAAALTLIGGAGAYDVLAAHCAGIAAGILFSLATKYFRPSSVKKIRVRPVHRNGHKVAEAAAMRLSDPERLDELLDKIRFSGFASLSEADKRELNEISRRLSQ